MGAATWKASCRHQKSARVERNEACALRTVACPCVRWRLMLDKRDVTTLVLQITECAHLRVVATAARRPANLHGESIVACDKALPRQALLASRDFDMLARGEISVQIASTSDRRSQAGRVLDVARPVSTEHLVGKITALVDKRYLRCLFVAWFLASIPF